ncbi:PAAR domain-containing protein [Aureibacter tunicatorum]|uniref:Zn-binding protein involved in type VI secretion n=1 Tax=Aureibacter tunicatorum TaxID=866807 RepID=A0AAE4BTQ4_9BACT|nr:PAAR domain-containing protein [Aureibacter tunicatorum]MDR6240043.1 putative Zn-binding protein involved in type VI secretion [Aureibacter tunicatorum]BDD04515.1 PAAR motif protein [Aureibacter tunicatorum]
MSRAAAVKKNDTFKSSTDLHLVQIPMPFVGMVTLPLPHTFHGKFTQGLSTNVKVEGKPAAKQFSGGKNDPKHVAKGIKFMVNPTNKGNVMLASKKVKINHFGAVNIKHKVFTCNDPAPLPMGKIKGKSSVNLS